MAIQFPIPLGGFFSLLPIKSASFDLGESSQHEETGNGEIIGSSLGQRLWEMNIKIRKGNYDEMEDVRALIRFARRSGVTFLAHPIPRAYPRYDPDGSLLGIKEAVLHTVNANRREIRLSGLPAGYRIARGDFLSFNYGTNPARWALHQSVNGTINADATGLTPFFEVFPAIRTGEAPNAPVRLKTPVFKAKIIPGSSSMGDTGEQQTDGISLSIRQTLGR